MQSSLKMYFCASPELDIIEEKIWFPCRINLHSVCVDKHRSVKESDRLRVNDYVLTLWFKSQVLWEVRKLQAQGRLEWSGKTPWRRWSLEAGWTRSIPCGGTQRPETQEARRRCVWLQSAIEGEVVHLIG